MLTIGRPREQECFTEDRSTLLDYLRNPRCPFGAPIRRHLTLSTQTSDETMPLIDIVTAALNCGLERRGEVLKKLGDSLQ